MNVTMAHVTDAVRTVEDVHCSTGGGSVAKERQEGRSHEEPSPSCLSSTSDDQASRQEMVFHLKMTPQVAQLLTVT